MSDNTAPYGNSIASFPVKINFADDEESPITIN